MSKQINCIFPLCTRKEEKNGFCFLHKIYSDVPDVKERPKPMSKKSAKRKEDDKIYKKIIKKQAKIDNSCMVKSPVCTGLMEGFNHRQKRSPSNLLKPDNLTPSCNACNEFIENNAGWAKSHGHLISRFIPTVLVAAHDAAVGAIIIEKR